LALLVLTGTSFQITQSAHVTGLPFSLSRIIGVLTLLSGGIWVMRRRAALTFSPQMIALAALGAVMAVSTLIVPDLELSLIGLSRISQLFLLYLLLANLAAERHTLLGFCGLLTVAATLSSLIGLAEHFLPGLEFQSGDPDLGRLGAEVEYDAVASGALKRVTGGLGFPNWFAYFLASAIPMNIAWWWASKDILPRLCVVLMTCLHLVGMMLSYTRSGMIALAAATVYLAVKKRIPVAGFWSISVLIVVGAIVWLPSGFLERSFSVSFLKAGSTPVRLALIEKSFDMLRDRPLLGYGFWGYGSEFMRRLQPKDDVLEPNSVREFVMNVELGKEGVHTILPHNIYLEVAVTYGLFGLSAFLAFVACIFRDLSIAERHGDSLERDVALSLKAGLLAFAVSGLWGHIFMMKLVWIFGGLAAALRRVVVAHVADESMECSSTSDLGVQDHGAVSCLDSQR
jgi:O-antigen ligase